MIIKNTYIIKRYLRLFLLTFLSLVFLIWLTQVISIIEFLSSKGIGIILFLKLSFFLIPEVMVTIIPFIGIITSIILALELLGQRELVIFKAAGLSNRKLLMPIELSAFIIFLFSFVLHFYLVPVSYTAFETNKEKIQNSNFSFNLRTNSVIEIADKIMLFAKEEKNNNYIIFYSRDEEQENIIYAKQGSVIKTQDEYLLNLDQGQIFNKRLKDNELDHFNLLKFDKLATSLNSSDKTEIYLSNKDKIKGLTLANYIEQDSLSGLDQNKLRTDFFQRVSWLVISFLLPILTFHVCISGNFNRQKGIKIQIFTSLFVSVSIIILHFMLKKELENLTNFKTIIILFFSFLFLLWRVDMDFLARYAKKLKRM